MIDRPSLRKSVLVAWTEWRRDDRTFTRLFDGPAFAFAVVAVVGWFTYVFANAFLAGESTLPVPPWLLVGLAVADVVWQSGRLTLRRLQRLEPALLCPTVPVRIPVIGLLAFVYARLLVRIVPPVAGVAAGLGLAFESPALGLSMLLATPLAVAVLVAAGSTGRLASYAVGKRVIGGRPVYGSVRLLAGAVLALLAAIVVSVGVADRITIASPVELGGPDASSVIPFVQPAGASIGTLTIRWLVVVAIALVLVAILVLMAIALVGRLWRTDPVGSSTSLDTGSLLAPGKLDRLLGGRLSRSTLTFLRATLRVERRNPRGLLYPAYVLVFVSFVGFPVIALAGLPFALWVVLALGLSAGVVFAVDPIARVYRPLPMLLTTADARTFVGGPLVGTVVAAVSLLAVGFVPLGLLNDASVLETLLLALVGVGFATTTASVALALELAVPYDAYERAPTMFTDVPTYGERGLGSFRRMGASFLLASAVGVPAFLGNAAWVYEPLADLGIPVGATRLGSLALTISVAACGSWWASRLAVERYRAYRLDS
ncbi:hypothetical protein C479_07518 [Halovivax asiaticus JCM 14624]|uniref:Uncharacterized protein n=1 Tax=Halovivax asiaticus JCM 14624 TaxID=1227490 RepID=M0BNE9_9EURY|nr:hypothetical protein [Halovivax asiaticus]ELZ11139.1 hypothetical protein C479_07518 [Halovivax asiaticus JCM 14624]